MSTMFATFDSARTGMGAYKLWLDAVADNVANIDNVTTTDEPAFAERFIVVESGGDAPGSGVRVTGAAFGDPNGRVTHEPGNPLADAEGMVRRPDIDLGEQMVYMQLAQRGYQANINTFERAREAYEAALSIGR
ncbi:flagellar basal body rod protein FlgC [Ilumatobacter sp.]|uniref:flagellar basal body rod protein FlgC n=1 Tax=Ilumatobacter sp. TaxID=1967498 RepID=UPI003B525DE3